jgi:putative MATE family efflux protein
MTKPKHLDTEPIPSLFFKYYFPALVSMLAVTLHQVINAIILAKQVGKEGVSAVGLFGPVFTLYIAFALALMIGGGILVGRSIGARDFTKTQAIFEFTTTVALLFSGFIALNSAFLARWIAEFLSGNDNTLIAESTSDYVFWGLLWMPFFLLRMIWGNLITHDQAPKISRNANLIAVSLNIVLDILLVIVFPYGVAGASIATGISIVVSCLYLAFYISKGRGHFSFTNFRFRISLPDWRQLFSFGVPTFVSEVSFALGLIVINHQLTTYGENAVAAFGIVNHLSFIFLRLLTAAMISALPIISFNIGAKRPERVLEMVKFSVSFSVVVGIVVALMGYWLPAPMIDLFSGDEPPEFKTVAVHAMGLYFGLFIAAGPNFILAAYLQSIGQTMLASFVHMFKGLLIVSALVYTLPHAFGLDGVWMSRALTEVVTLAFIVMVTFFGRRKYYSHAAILGGVKS